MDISSLSTKEANEEGVEVVLVDPLTGDELTNDDGKPMIIMVVGKDSSEYRRWQSEVDAQNRGRKTPSYAKRQTLALELLARCTKSFINLQMNGAPWSFHNPTP